MQKVENLPLLTLKNKTVMSRKEDDPTQETVEEFHRAIVNHDSYKVVEMLDKNKKLAVTYLMNQDTFQEMYEHTAITFDEINDPGISHLLELGSKVLLRQRVFCLAMIFHTSQKTWLKHFVAVLQMTIIKWQKKY